MKYLVLILLMMNLSTCKKKNLANELNDLKITTSSTLREHEVPWDHDPYYLVSGNNKAVWCAEGSTATISLEISSPIELKYLRIINGRALSSKVINQNPQISKLKLTSYSGGKKSGSTEDIKIDKTEFEKSGKAIPREITLEKSLIGDKFDLEITDVHEGTHSKNVCVTSIELGIDEEKKPKYLPVSNLKEIIEKLKTLDIAKRHYWAFNMLKKYSNLETKRSGKFCNINRCLNLFLNSDGTFALERYPLKPDEEPEIEFRETYNEEAIQKDPMFAFKSSTGSYKSNKISPEEGVELNLRFYDENGNEQNEFWYLKSVKKNEKLFDDFKTLMGVKVKDYNSKSYYLLHLKSVKENGYHSEMEFFSVNVPYSLKEEEERAETAP